VTGRTQRRAAAGLLLGLLLVVVGAAPAGAITPRPTDDRSRVTGIDPGGVVAARVIGGDSLVEITVDRGHEVVVLGYGGEPYLRVQPDGTVQINRRSAAVALNRTRDGDAATLAAPVTTDVDWQPHGGGGVVAWHDHRIHVAEGVEVTAPIEWKIPMTVDGSAGAVDGRLERLASPSPLPALVGAIALAAVIWLLGRGRPTVAIVVALGLAGVIAGATGFAEWHSLPTTVARNAGLFLLPLAALGAVAVGALSRHRTVRLVAMAASVSLLAGWIAFRWSILTRAVLVSDLAPALDRTALAVVLGSTIAAAGLLVSWAGASAVTLPADADPRGPGALEPGR
jgi:hypothetical protein